MARTAPWTVRDASQLIKWRTRELSLTACGNGPANQWARVPLAFRCSVIDPLWVGQGTAGANPNLAQSDRPVASHERERDAKHKKESNRANEGLAKAAETLRMERDSTLGRVFEGNRKRGGVEGEGETFNGFVRFRYFAPAASKRNLTNSQSGRTVYYLLSFAAVSRVAGGISKRQSRWFCCVWCYYYFFLFLVLVLCLQTIKKEAHARLGS